MSALARLFFRSHYVTERTPAEVVSWWESRRFVYNAVVGSAGVVTLATVHLMAALPPNSRPIPWLPTLAVAGVYGISANIFYTSGWIVELLMRKRFGDVTEQVGPALFRYGFAFSVGLTLLPNVVAMFSEAVRLVSWIFT